MTQKTSSLLSIASIGMIFVCCTACSGDSSSKDNEQQNRQKKEQTKNDQIADAHNSKPQSATPTTSTAPTAQQDSDNQSTSSQGNLSKEDLRKASEAFGHFIGKSLKSAPGISFDIDTMIQGLRDGYADKPAPMSEKDYEALMVRIQEQAYKETAANNLKAANDYLEKNATAADVKTIEPGKLQYKILQKGSGEVVKEHDTPQINYVGKFIDGRVFSSSTDTGGPISLPLDQTIAGFSKGIVGMHEGEKRELYIHPDLGYGASGHLPPNSLLIFEVEVLKANAPKSSTDTAEDDSNMEDPLDGLEDLDDDDQDADDDADQTPQKDKK